jgi:hypothetical protein
MSADKVTRVLADSGATVVTVARGDEVFIVAIDGSGPEHDALLAEYLGISIDDLRRAS